MNQSIILAPEIAQLPAAPVINSEGERIKQELLAKSQQIVAIHTAEHRDLTVADAGRIKAHLNAVEKDRKDIKEPFFRMGQKIDQAAAEHVKELDTELRRLNNLVGQFNEEQRLESQRKQQEIERQQREAREQEERLRREQEKIAEEARKKAEAAAAKGKELTDKQKAAALRADLEAEERLEQAEAARKQLADEQFKQAELARQQKPTGGMQRMEISVEVTDIHALYAARRDCVRLAPDLTQIKYLANNNPDVILPGVVLTRTPVFSSKAR